MVSAAVAGDDLQSLVGSASEALGCPVAIALPALGATVVWPPGSSTSKAVSELVAHAAAAIRGEDAERPSAIADSVPIRIGHDVVGIVAALCEHGSRRVERKNDSMSDRRAWLEAAAAAAAVATLIRESPQGDLEASRRALLLELSRAPIVDLSGLLGQSRRLGFDLSSGAVAICARWRDGNAPELPEIPDALLATMGQGRVLGLLPLAAKPGDDDRASPLAADLSAHGMDVGLSAPRRDPAALHEALREAELMVELAVRPETGLGGQEETHRLLIGVLLRDPAELELLRARTVAPLGAYDAEHDTELLTTLQAFLAHHGSTTDTAETMRLHRHTVGYRLSRVQEVSGLSPYESDGRERLSLGLKARQILEADRRIREP